MQDTRDAKLTTTQARSSRGVSKIWKGGQVHLRPRQSSSPQRSCQAKVRTTASDGLQSPVFARLGKGGLPYLLPHLNSGPGMTNHICFRETILDSSLPRRPQHLPILRSRHPSLRHQFMLRIRNMLRSIRYLHPIQTIQPSRQSICHRCRCLDSATTPTMEPRRNRRATTETRR